MKSITIENISKQYGPVVAVNNVSLQISEGELFFLLGPSGCGKTTLLKIIAGLIEPTQGKVLVGDRNVTNEDPQTRNTALVFQNYALWPHMTVYQNVEFGPKVRGISSRQRRTIADEHLERVQMNDMGKRKPNQLSGGQQQRVALARALASGAECLLLDEPLSNLDAKLRLIMRTELRNLIKTSHATAVYVTHDQKEALSMADRIAVMNHGAIEQIDTPEQLYNHPNSRFVADFIGEANFITGRVSHTDNPITIETPAGTIRAQTDRNFPPDSAVTCCIRPENITIQADPTDLHTTISATIESETYLGESRQYACRLEDGTVWRASAPPDKSQRLNPGKAVALHIKPTDVQLLTR